MRHTRPPTLVKENSDLDNEHKRFHNKTNNVKLNTLVQDGDQSEVKAGDTRLKVAGL